MSCWKIPADPADVFADLKECFKSFFMPVVEEETDEEHMYFASLLDKKQGEDKIAVLYYPEDDFIEMSIMLPVRVPYKKIKLVGEIINLINAQLDVSHFAIDPDLGGVFARSGIFVYSNHLNVCHVYACRNELLFVAAYGFHVIKEQIFSKLAPKDLFVEHRITNRRQFLNKKEKSKMLQTPIAEMSNKHCVKADK